jgi:hypothetical protein
VAAVLNADQILLCTPKRAIGHRPILAPCRQRSLRSLRMPPTSRQFAL